MRFARRWITAFSSRDLAIPLIAGAVAVRLAFCFLYAGAVDSFDVPALEGETLSRAGADGYVQIARTLFESGEYSFGEGMGPAHNRPPVQPFLMLIFGAWSARGWLYIWFIGSALISLGYLAALHRLGGLLSLPVVRRNLLLLAAGFHPYLIFMSKTTTFIGAATLVLTAGALLFLAIPRHPRTYALLCGFACGAGILTHGSFLVLPFVLIVLLLFRREMTIPKRFTAAILIAIACAATILPWTARNYRHFHRIIPSATGAGYQYWIGDAAYFRHEFRGGHLYRERTGRDLGPIVRCGTSDPAEDAVLVDLAKEQLLRDRLRVVKRLAIGYLAFWAPWDRGAAKSAVSGALNYPVVIATLLLFGAAAIRRRLSYGDLALAAMILSFVSVFAFFTAYGSYFSMIMPLLLLLLARLASAARPAGTPSPATAPAVTTRG